MAIARRGLERPENGATVQFEAAAFRELQAVVLLKRPGIVVNTWARDGRTADATGVMAATLLEALEGLQRSLGSGRIRDSRLETERLRLLFAATPRNLVVMCAAPQPCPWSNLELAARKVLSQLSNGVD
jgi:predicted regulator of Ras-like GTPase activity (Roadblock/LC7/MglB family)